MDAFNRRSLASLTIFAVLVSSVFHTPVVALKKSHIVYLGGHPHSRGGISPKRQQLITESHHEALGNVIGSKEMAKDAIFYSYTKYINGFAANLEEEEVAAISRHPGALSVFENRAMELHTAHSWDFLRLERDDGMVPKESLWSKARFGEDIIIGNIDTGARPESESFSDDGLGPIPSKWKGICQESKEGAPRINCNRKLIGARYFNQGLQSSKMGGGMEVDQRRYQSSYDVDGHGTHTLSIAGGAPVPSVSIFGYGNGTARGGSPAARVAAYRACFPPTVGRPLGACHDADILAAFDAAIHDGVDVISVSLGSHHLPDAANYMSDSIAIGSFHAVRNGVVVVASAGNRGPAAGTVGNVAPWIITVGATTLDREFDSFLVLGNGHRLMGQSLSSDILPEGLHPMILGEHAATAYAPPESARQCQLGSLAPEKVKGKIAICERSGTGSLVGMGVTIGFYGGVGMVVVKPQGRHDDVNADPHLLPATHINRAQTLRLLHYINSTQHPEGYITKPVTRVGAKPAPYVASFSARGPNSLNPEILKPDITAPGVAIIAAFPEDMPPSYFPFVDNRRVKFNALSGTSMSCPHVSGVVGLLKTLHPSWSPAAIKSAIMTTARIRDNTGEAMLNSSGTRTTPFCYGSGHIVPNRAMDPGLVYDATITDYLLFLCSIGYDSTQIAKFATDPFTCPSKPTSPSDLNYPSIAVPNLSALDGATVRRRVKNVGTGPVTYVATVVPPRGVNVVVVPRRLRFERSGEEKGFEVRMKVVESQTVVAVQRGNYVFGGLIWSDGVHHVRSPLVVRVTN